jgi:hypothetical protein
MAGLKKPTKKRDASNPNTVLVVFLVLFVLLSIGLGIGMYYGYAGQEKLRASAKEEINKAAANKVGEDFALFMAYDLALAAGIPLDADRLATWKSLRDQVLDDNGKFKEEKGRPVLKQIRDNNSALLGGFDNDQAYKTTYKAKLAKAEAEAKDAKAAMTTARTEADEAKKGLGELQLKSEKYWTDVIALIKKGNKAALDKAKEMSKTMEKEIEINAEQQKELQGIHDKYKGDIEKLQGTIRVLQKKEQDLKERIKDSTSMFVTRNTGEPHALVLDISKGKTMWDQPKGKIVRVDFGARQVIISLGGSDGVQPEMTFNVFGGNMKVGAEGLLKGTVEVIRVLDAHSSLARITSLYDASGMEIALNDPAVGRVSREAGNLMKKDDLLFNLTFGSHAFITGLVHWSGPAAATPAGQMRNLREFISILEREGVKVDGYIDLTDGKVIGGITPKTRFIIRGDSFVIDKKAAKEEEKADDATVSREKAVNDAMLAVRNDAIEKGLFIISADNLVHVIGYRRPRSASDSEISSFRPSLPSGAAAGN